MFKFKIDIRIDSYHMIRQIFSTNIQNQSDVIQIQVESNCCEQLPLLYFYLRFT